MTGFSDTIEVEFIGGQRDGEICRMREFPDRIYMPIVIVPHLSYASPDSVDYTTAAALAEVYRLALHADGIPSLDDRGRRRYEYVGLQ